jgi:hypothetical protein
VCIAARRAGWLALFPRTDDLVAARVFELAGGVAAVARGVVAVIARLTEIQLGVAATSDRVLGRRAGERSIGLHEYLVVITAEQRRCRQSHCSDRLHDTDPRPALVLPQQHTSPARVT